MVCPRQQCSARSLVNWTGNHARQCPSTTAQLDFCDHCSAEARGRITCGSHTEEENVDCGWIAWWMKDAKLLEERKPKARWAVWRKEGTWSRGLPRQTCLCALLGTFWLPGTSAQQPVTSGTRGMLLGWVVNRGRGATPTRAQSITPPGRL